MKKTSLTLGPVLFNWTPEDWRDFYFRIADEAPVDTVYLGEVVCSKRAPFFEPLYADVAERLKKAKKQVVFSTLAEVMLPREREMVSSLCAAEDDPVEANDVTALYFLRGKPHRIGPYVNAYNEETLAILAARGAVHVTLPPELSKDALPAMAAAAKKIKVGLEVQVYGRIPLALSARCYHARAHGRIKDNCQFICGEDPDGMELRTSDGEKFLAINGIQTLSHGCLNLLRELFALQAVGIEAFRLSPHSRNMIKVAEIFRATINGEIDAESACSKLRKLNPAMPFIDGFYHHKAGCTWSEPDQKASRLIQIKTA